MCVPSETKNINGKVFNMITRMNEVKTLVKQISCDCKCNFNSTTCDSNQKWNNNKCLCKCKKYPPCKKDFSWNPNICICKNSRYFKSAVDNSVIVCDQIINVIESVSTNVTNTISTNVTSTVSINSNDNKKRYTL